MLKKGKENNSSSKFDYGIKKVVKNKFHLKYKSDSSSRVLLYLSLNLKYKLMRLYVCVIAKEYEFEAEEEINGG